MKDKIITLLQTIINKIRGLQMTAPIPQEKFADYLEEVIGVVNDADLDVPNELPAVGTNDKNKVLHTNESTGALEWAEGGALVACVVRGTLNKTWQEINDAIVGGIPSYTLRLEYEDQGSGIIANAYMALITGVFIDGNTYWITTGTDGQEDYEEYESIAPDGYPAII